MIFLHRITSGSDRNGRHRIRVSLFFERSFKKLCLFTAALTFLSSFSGCADISPKTAEETSYLMDTIVQQKWYGENAQKTCDEINEALKELESRISLYINSSEIAKINENAGKAYTPVSDEVYKLIDEALRISAASGGVFDITIAPLVLTWDITADDPHVPEQKDIDEAVKKIDYRKVRLNDTDKSVFLEEEGMKLDLGGIAKGMAAGAMKALALENNVTGYLSIGGNMLVVGEKPDGSDFKIGIRDPLGEQNDYFATIVLDGYTMATSSASERYFEEDGIIYHHILDPFTGYPVESDLLSVSVISENGLLADALSTTIFMKGSDCLGDYIDSEDFMIVAVTEDRDIFISEDLWGNITPAENKAYRFYKGLN